MVGDTVVFIGSDGKNRVGRIIDKVETGFGAPSTCLIKDRDDQHHTVPFEHIVKPLETTPQEFWSRWAYGAAKMEYDSVSEHYGEHMRAVGAGERFTDEFRWLFDGYRYSPGGRIQLGLGHEYLGKPKANVTLVNCFRGDTVVQTKNGPRPIRDLSGDIEVLSQDGVFRTADFRSYGTQELFKVTFSNGDEFFATADHQWVVRTKHGTERVTTLSLEGRKIPIVETPWRPEKNDDFFAGVRHGIVYGDGSTCEEAATSHVLLFGDKRNLRVYFDDYKLTTHEEYVRVSGLPKDFKNALPSESASASYWYGFVVGLIATDGNCDDYGCVTINQSDRGALETVRRSLHRIGMVASSLKMTRERSPYNGELAPSHTLRLYKQSVKYEDLIRPFHRDKRLLAKESCISGSIAVTSVEPTSQVEEVFCCVEPETHTIVIGAGYLTGQCFVGPKVECGGSVLDTNCRISLRVDPVDQWRKVLDNLRNQIEVQRRGGGYGVNITDIATVVGAASGTVRFYLNSTHKDYAELESLKASGKFDGVDEVGKSVMQRSTGDTVIAVPDSIDGIIESLNEMVVATYNGESVVVSFTDLRPRHAPVSTIGRSSGAASWMTLFALAVRLLKQTTIDAVDFAELFAFTTNLVEQGGSRRGALMIVYNVDGPVIEKFVTRKREPGQLVGANVSVGISDEFMSKAKGYQEAVDDGEDWMFADFPEYVEAHRIWSLIVESAHASAEPGVLFMGRINNEANSWYYATIDATNPCGEEPIPKDASCNLGHLVLPRFVISEIYGNDEDTTIPTIDWFALERATRLAVRFQDDCIDYSNYPTKATKAQQLLERRVGIGTMGLGTLLIMLGMRYGSDEALDFIDELYAYIACFAYDESMNLAKEKGSFPAFEYDEFVESGFMRRLLAKFPKLREKLRTHGIRNVTLLTQAPTGSTGTMLDNIPGMNVSTGIEPYYAWAYERAGRLGVKSQEVALVGEYRKANGLGPDDDLPDYFVTSMELTPEEHVRMQATIQKWVDSSISKTINLPESATVEDASDAYLLAYELGCKGVTLYRDNSRDAQVLSTEKGGASIESHIETEATGEKTWVNHYGKIVQEIEQTMLDDKRVTAAEGGCWYCERASGELYFCTEFDTYVHIDCVKKALRDDPTDQEAQIIADEFNIPYEAKPALTKRPRRVHGFTERLDVAVGDTTTKVYVTVNVDDAGDPFEVFVNANDASVADIANALGRMVTQMLRYGATDDNCAQAVKHLRRSQSNMMSLPSQLARLLEEVASRGVTFPVNDNTPIGEAEAILAKVHEPGVISRKFSKCPSCGEMTYDQIACACNSCGHSKCS